MTPRAFGYGTVFGTTLALCGTGHWLGAGACFATLYVVSLIDLYYLDYFGKAQ